MYNFYARMCSVHYEKSQINSLTGRDFVMKSLFSAVKSREGRFFIVHYH